MNTKSDKYDSLFFDYVDSGALRSADIFVELLRSELHITSMLDVGCGRGGWAGRWKAGGCAEVLGIDGDYVNRSSLYVLPDEFAPVDLNRPFDLHRKFDFVQSLEVAEHLRPTSSENFVASIVRHGDVVLFSAAVPGQGGTGHINERPLQFWRELFAAHGYQPFDFLRPLTCQDNRVEPWYRYNSILYVSDDGRHRLNDRLLATEVRAGEPLVEMASIGWRVRRAFLNRLPVAIVDKMAVVNARLRSLTASRSK